MTTKEVNPILRAQGWFDSGSATLAGDAIASLSNATSATLFYQGSENVQVEVNQMSLEHLEELRRSAWFYPTLDSMLALRHAAGNWSFATKRTQHTTIGRMLEILSEILNEHTPPPSIVPTWCGGIQAEWHRNGVDLEIEVFPSGEIEYFFKGPDEEQEGRAWDALGRLNEYTHAVL